LVAVVSFAGVEEEDEPQAERQQRAVAVRVNPR